MSDEMDDPPEYVQENDLNQEYLFTEPNAAPPYLPTSNPYQQCPPPYSQVSGTIPPTQQPYPPQYSPTTEMPPYPQYQPQYYAPQQRQQQQQQQQNMNVVLGAPTAQFVISSRPYYINFTNAYVLSCFAFFFCGWMCGLIAFIIAMVGQSSASDGDDTRARRMLRASYGFSIAGIIIGGIVIIILLAVFLSPRASRTSSTCGTTSFCSYGKYYDSSDCKQCCFQDSSSSSPCYWSGYYYSNGAKRCCY